MAKSRYFPTRLIKDPSVAEPQHYATWDLPESVKGYEVQDLLDGQQVLQHVWQLGDRMDKLASKYFGDDDYWWVIALVNGITFPLGAAPGTVLRVPSDIDRVLEQLDMV